MPIPDYAPDHPPAKQQDMEAVVHSILSRDNGGDRPNIDLLEIEKALRIAPNSVAVNYYEG